ncbi:MAG: Single-stranded nucleic acid binding R3H domain-containing protein [Microgenomates group bacterium GW2011_GWF2_47_9]|nr:MAG: Single-stranded nucleic acid binding R3H domain-containing protein [Microgenomates group bacterium GW2011_GWF2_47_9]
MSIEKQLQDNIIQFLNYLNLNTELITFEDDGELLTISVALPAEDAGIYIGRYASTLDSIQLLISLMVNKSNLSRHILFDVGGYRENRLKTLQEMVARISAKVLETGSAHAMPPLSSTERRQVHVLLSQDETFTTYSEGEGGERRLFISKKN